MKSVRLSTPLVISMLFAHAIMLQAAHATVTLNDGGVTKLEVTARDTNISIMGEIDSLFPTTLPIDATHTATQGNSNSQAQYSFNQDGISIISMGARDGLLDSGVNVQPAFFFSVSVNTPYLLTGMLSTDDPSAKFVALSATLTDIDTSAVLFNSNQESFGVVDEVLTLGGSGGNQNNELSGSATGLLLAGHRYRLFYGTSIYAANSGSSATFSGVFQASFVPEPSTGYLCLLGLVLPISRRRQV